jgi:hypothetical protein
VIGAPWFKRLSSRGDNGTVAGSFCVTLALAPLVQPIGAGVPDALALMGNQVLVAGAFSSAVDDLLPGRVPTGTCV